MLKGPYGEKKKIQIIKVTDKRRDGAEVISIRGKEFHERATEDLRENDGLQEVFSHLAAMPQEMRGGWGKKRRG